MQLALYSPSSASLALYPPPTLLAGHTLGVPASHTKLHANHVLYHLALIARNRASGGPPV